MTKDQAMDRLARAGLFGADARTALAHAMVGFDDIDAMLDEADKLDANKLWSRFGQDGGRAVVILRKARR